MQKVSTGSMDPKKEECEGNETWGAMCLIMTLEPI